MLLSREALNNLYVTERSILFWGQAYPCDICIQGATRQTGQPSRASLETCLLCRHDITHAIHTTCSPQCANRILLSFLIISLFSFYSLSILAVFKSFFGKTCTTFEFPLAGSLVRPNDIPRANRICPGRSSVALLGKCSTPDLLDLSALAPWTRWHVDWCLMVHALLVSLHCLHFAHFCLITCCLHLITSKLLFFIKQLNHAASLLHLIAIQWSASLPWESIPTCSNPEPMKCGFRACRRLNDDKAMTRMTPHATLSDLSVCQTYIWI